MINILKPAHTKRVTIVIATMIAAGTLIAAPVSAHNNDIRTKSITATAALSAATGFQHDQLSVYPAIAKAAAERDAAAAIAAANIVLAATSTKVDPAPLTTSLASLASFKTLPLDEVRERITATTEAANVTAAAAAEVDRLAAEAAAAAAAAAQAAAEAAAEAARIVNTPDGAKATARSIAASQYGWGDSEFSCLSRLWQKESGWNVSAHNASSGATGIPQSLPGSKMASAGADWATNAATQISWGLTYIDGRYGSPCAAMAHSSSVNWY